MASIGHHLARRAFDVTQDSFRASQSTNPADEPQDDARKQRLTWGIALIWVTAIIFMAIMSAVSQAWA